jgi:hypothetical protein
MTSIVLLGVVSKDQRHDAEFLERLEFLLGFDSTIPMEAQKKSMTAAHPQN